MTIRAGYYTEPSAIPDETLTITIADVNRRHAINLGASYDFGLFKFFLSYENILIGDREVKTWNFNNDPNAPGFDNMAGTYKMSVTNFMTGIGFKF